LWSAKERGGMGYLSYPNLHRVSLIERCLIHSVNCRKYDNKDLEKVIKKISYILNHWISFQSSQSTDFNLNVIFIHQMLSRKLNDLDKLFMCTAP
jgi:hypothetical protein